MSLKCRRKIADLSNERFLKLGYVALIPLMKSNNNGVGILGLLCLGQKGKLDDKEAKITYSSNLTEDASRS